jgi:hypothetical protein
MLEQGTLAASVFFKLATTVFNIIVEHVQIQGNEKRLWKISIKSGLHYKLNSLYLKKGVNDLTRTKERFISYISGNGMVCSA